MYSIQNLYKFFQPIWAFIRERRIYASHVQVVKLWNEIFKYFNDETLQVCPKKEFSSNNMIIWQYWGQNENIPQVVQDCFDSVYRYRGEYSVIRLNDTNFSDYLEFPDYVLNKLKYNESFNRTFFSDLLRVALLSCYGGVWLDATVYLTNPIPDKFSNMPYFMFQRDLNEKNKKYWKNSYATYWGWDNRFRVNVLNSIIFSKKDNPVMKCLLINLLKYWKSQEKIHNYFIFQILYDIIIKDIFPDQKCETISDTYPHMLQSKFNGGEITEDISTILKLTSIHKMTYYEGKAFDAFKDFDKSQRIKFLG